MAGFGGGIRAPAVNISHHSAHADVLKSKKALGWRTLLVVPELDAELEVLGACKVRGSQWLQAGPAAASGHVTPLDAQPSGCWLCLSWMQVDVFSCELRVPPRSPPTPPHPTTRARTHTPVPSCSFCLPAIGWASPERHAQAA